MKDVKVFDGQIRWAKLGRGLEFYFFFSSRRRHTRFRGVMEFRRVLFRSRTIVDKNAHHIAPLLRHI